MILIPLIKRTKAGFSLKFMGKNGEKVLWSEPYERIASCYAITTFFGYTKSEVKVIDVRRNKGKS